MYARMPTVFRMIQIRTIIYLKIETIFLNFCLNMLKKLISLYTSLNIANIPSHYNDHEYDPLSPLLERATDISLLYT